MTQEFEPGKRYPLTEDDFRPVAAALWPIVSGKPDYSLGRRFIAPPCEWEFWMKDGRKVNFSYSRYGLIGGCENDPDPDRPKPLDKIKIEEATQ